MKHRLLLFPLFGLLAGCNSFVTSGAASVTAPDLRDHDRSVIELDPGNAMTLSLRRQEDGMTEIADSNALAVWEVDAEPGLYRLTATIESRTSRGLIDYVEIEGEKIATFDPEGLITKPSELIREEDVSFGKFLLEEGEQELRLHFNGRGRFGDVRLVPEVVPPTTGKPAAQLVTNDPTPAAERLFAQIESGFGEPYRPEKTALPLRSFELKMGDVGELSRPIDELASEIEASYGEGEVPLIRLRYLAPMPNGQRWDASALSREEPFKDYVNISRLIDHPDSDLRKRVEQDIDALATLFAELQQRELAVAFDTGHLAPAGGWALNPYKYNGDGWMHRFVKERLTEEHGIRNVIWTWRAKSYNSYSTGDPPEIPYWGFPGEEHVDLVLADLHTSMPQLAGNYDALNKAIGDRKVIAYLSNGTQSKAAEAYNVAWPVLTLVQ